MARDTGLSTLPIINDLCIQLHHSVAQEIETLGLNEVLLPYDHRCSVGMCCVWMEVLKKVVLVGSGEPHCNELKHW